MAWYIKNEFDYNDNGRKIHKQEWVDDETGETWDAFNDVGTWDDVSSGDGRSTWSQNNSSYASTATNSAPVNSSSGGQMANPPQRDDWSKNPSAGGGQSAPTGSSGSMYTGGQSGGGQLAVNEQLYNPDNPAFAVQNVLRNMGLNPFSGNPLTQAIMARAPAYSGAYRAQAANGYNPGADIGGGFQNFLTNIFSSGNQSDVLANTAANFGGIANAARSFGDQLSANPSLQGLNPLMASLANMVLQQGGMGGLNLLATLMSGYMPASVAGASRQYLGGAGSAALQDVLQQSGGVASDQNIFDILFRQ